MKPFKSYFTVLAMVLAGGLWGCASSASKSPDVAGAIRQSLKASGLKDVAVADDRDKGVVALSGHVADEAQKAQAESAAVALAPGQVIANEIAIVPPGAASEAKQINSDVDQGIEKNLDAALLQDGLRKQVSYQVRNGVITLTGAVNSQAERDQVAQIAAAVPYRQQVVNELQVKNQKASAIN